MRVPHPGGGHYLLPLGDPPLDPPDPPDHYLQAAEMEPGVWLVVDENGEEPCGFDTGPFSTEQDCRWALEWILRRAV